MLFRSRDLLFKIKPNVDLVVKHPDFTMRVVTHVNLPDIGFRGGIIGGAPWAVAVGDSFTFGQGVDHEETWTSLLAGAIGKDVINLGVPAQGPVQYTRILKRYGLAMAPRVVFYGLYFNDLDSAVRFRRLSGQIFPVRRYLREYSMIYNLVLGARGQSDQPPEIGRAHV